MAETEDELALILGGIACACNLEAAALLLEAEIRSKPRSHWVKPQRDKPRRDCSNIQFLLKEHNLFDDGKAYTSFLRLDQKCFSQILGFVKADIQRADTTMRKCIPVEEKLAATLRFLATGETLKDIAETSELSASYLNDACIEVCTAIYKNMKSEFVQFPQSKEKWLQVANEFEMRWQFPLCLGALAVKHILFKPKKKQAHLCYNDEGLTSIVLLALADANCKFLFIDVGCNGGFSDSENLGRSNLMDVLNNESNFPDPKVIGYNRKLPYVIVADNAFPNVKRILTPYSKSNLSKENIIFNTRLSRARQNIERAFRILSNRFCVLRARIRHDDVKTTIIVQACCVLHNFLMHNSETYAENIDFINADTGTESENTATTINFNNRSYERIRTEFTQYFCNEGQFETNQAI